MRHLSTRLYKFTRKFPVKYAPRNDMNDTILIMHSLVHLYTKIIPEIYAISHKKNRSCKRLETKI